MSGLSLRLPAENAYFALKAYANIWQSGLNLSDCTLDPREKLIQRENKDERQGGERELEGGRKTPFSVCVRGTYTEMCPLPQKGTIMSHLNLSPLFCRVRRGGNKPQPPQRGTGHPWSSNLSLRCAVAYKDGAVIEVSTQREI